MLKQTEQIRKNQKEALEIFQVAWEAYLAESGATKESISEAMGIRPSTLGQYLHGHINLNTDFLIQMSGLFKDFDPLLGESLIKLIRQPKAYTLPIKYTLSGTEPETPVFPVSTVVDTLNCYGVLVDVPNAVQPQNSISVVDPNMQVHKGDLIVVKRPRKKEAIVGYLDCPKKDQWAVSVPGFGGYDYLLLKSNDKIDRVVGQFFPRASRKLFNPKMLSESA